MAVDPRISLAANAGDLSNIIPSALQTFNLAQQAMQQRELQPLRQQLLESQVAQAQAAQPTALEQFDAAENNRLRSIASFAQTVIPDLQAGNTDKVKAALENRFRALDEQGINTDDTVEAIGTFNRNPEDFLQDAQQAVQLATQRGLLADPSQQLTAGQREFASLTAGFTPEERAKAQRVRARIEAPAVGSAAITTATTEGLTEKLATSEEEIKQRTKFAEMTGASRSKTIDDAFSRVQKIDTNLGNINRAIQAIDDGASTGAIESRFFPSFRRSTKELEQVQKELGLDVIGSVTFGALSEGELNLALETALPTNLEPQALREFLVNKREAQTKLRQYFRDQMDFLDDGGTISQFLRQQERSQAQQPVQQSQPQPQQTEQPVRFVFDPATGQVVPK